MADNLQHRLRELMRDLRECPKTVRGVAEAESLLVLAMADTALNRPSQMSRFQDAYIELLIEEAEQFVALVSTVTLETDDGFSRSQRSSFRKIVTDLRRDLERFTSDALLVIGDKQEIRRRIEAS